MFWYFYSSLWVYLYLKSKAARFCFPVCVPVVSFVRPLLSGCSPKIFVSPAATNWRCGLCKLLAILLLCIYICIVFMLSHTHCMHHILKNIKLDQSGLLCMKPSSRSFPWDLCRIDSDARGVFNCFILYHYCITILSSVVWSIHYFSGESATEA